MRATTLIIALSLLMTAVAFAPTAAADRCATGGTVAACTSGVTITNGTTNCVWGGQWEETTVGPVTYREWVCNEGPNDPR